MRRLQKKQKKKTQIFFFTLRTFELFFLSQLNYNFNVFPQLKSYKKQSKQKKPVEKSQIWADAVLYI